MQNIRERDFCVSTSPPLAPMESVADCPVDVCLEGQGIPIRAERYDDARRMNPRVGPQVASYYEEAPNEVPRLSHPKTPGTNGVSHLDPHNQTQARVSRQPQACFAQSTSNPTPLTVRQADDLQRNVRQLPRTTNCTVNYTNGAARKNNLEQADPTAFLRRDNLPQMYTTNSGATFAPNNSVSLTKIPDAVPFSSRSTFPMPPAPVAYNFRQDRLVWILLF
ncbi:unnamed protein product [Dibothriocephalus latus]|uniref:Uncharacterized protein n=1 Tax=Dibothriocephalus latus TaxID=60516 RepID=A0A3P6SE01_DIBLA|nr:unnamed protein product [Dibothriocephalus latus]